MTGWQTVEKKRGPRPASNTMGDHIKAAMKKSPRGPRHGSGERSLAPADEPAEAKPTVMTLNRFKSLEKAVEDKEETGIAPKPEVKKKERETQIKRKRETFETFVNEPQKDCRDNECIVTDAARSISDSNSMHSGLEDAEDQDENHGMNIFEYEDDPLMPIGDDEVILEVTADTGAVDNVANPRELPGFKVQESPGSRNGKHFMGAGAERIKNEGQVKLSMEPIAGGKKLGATFQAAEITRALMSISKVCDSAPDTTVTFDSKAGIVTRRGKEIAKFPRKGGLYVMQVRVKKPKNEEPKNGNDRPTKDFTRQGVNR